MKTFSRPRIYSITDFSHFWQKKTSQGVEPCLVWSKHTVLPVHQLVLKGEIQSPSVTNQISLRMPAYSCLTPVSRLEQILEERNPWRPGVVSLVFLHFRGLVYIQVQIFNIFGKKKFPPWELNPDLLRDREKYYHCTKGEGCNLQESNLWLYSCVWSILPLN